MKLKTVALMMALLLFICTVCGCNRKDNNVDEDEKHTSASSSDKDNENGDEVEALISQIRESADSNNFILVYDTVNYKVRNLSLYGTKITGKIERVEDSDERYLMLTIEAPLYTVTGMSALTEDDDGLKIEKLDDRGVLVYLNTYEYDLNVKKLDASECYVSSVDPDFGIEIFGFTSGLAMLEIISEGTRYRYMTANFDILTGQMDLTECLSKISRSDLATKKYSYDYRSKTWRGIDSANVDVLERCNTLSHRQEKLLTNDKFSIRQNDGTILLTGKDLESVSAEYSADWGHYIALKFNEEGTKKFLDATTKNLGNSLPIYIDDSMISCPTVNSAITNGEAVITGDFTAENVFELSWAIGGAMELK